MPMLVVPHLPRGRALPPVPVPPPLPPHLHKGYESECGREEIYVTSSSVIELDSSSPSSPPPTTDGSDSGIYNASTDTGCSSCCSSSGRRERPGSTFLLTRHRLEEFLSGYEEQEASVWIDFGLEDEELYSAHFVYESIYEEIPAEVSEVKVGEGKERPSGLTKKIKKLRRNWSLKKEDISKGLSKIKKSSKTLIEDVYWKEARFTTVGTRRKISLSQLLSTDQPELRGDTNTNNVSTFYIAGPNTEVKQSVQPADPTSGPPSLPTAPTRRRPGRWSRSVPRPLDPPPAPPLPSSPPPCEATTSTEAIYTSSLFLSEPLYQFYVERERVEEVVEEEEGGLLEEIYADLAGSDPAYQASPGPWGAGPVQRLLASPEHRSLWADLPQVQASGLLDTLTPGERRLQEAAFEIVSSEASYLKSLNVLVFHFANSAQFAAPSALLSAEDRNVLFSNVVQVRARSEGFLAALESRWQEERGVRMPSIADILLEHTRKHFPVYSSYCAAQPAMDRRLKHLRQSSPGFAAALQELEGDQVCQGLSLYSFLMLPMQRVTRLPLLCSALLSHLPPSHPQLLPAQQALAALTSLVGECNEAARREEREEELAQLARLLDWRGLEPLEVEGREGRWLERSSTCSRLSWKDSPDKLTFGRRGSRQGLTLLLLSDWLLVTKRKGDRLAVLDLCPRNLLQVSPVEAGCLPSLLPDPALALWLVLLQNSEQKTVEMLVSLPTLAEARWWSTTPHHSSPGPGGEVHYLPWDIPRVEVVGEREGREEEELTVSSGEQGEVLRRRQDGWLYLQIGTSKGWVPPSLTQEVESSHRRAKNFRQRYQFLQALADPEI